MYRSGEVVLRVLLLVIVGSCAALKFPPGFKFGAATSSYQIEGAWNVSDKGESIWDRFLHENPGMTVDGSNGDVACDSYHKWEDDVRIAAEIGIHFYRFSVSWTRLLPNGTPEKISEDGKKYYNSLINGLLEKGIEPVVTLYHWDLPQRLQDLGGWSNPLIAEWFEDYAKVVYSLYGDRVKRWITINEPIIICDFVYNTGFFAPGKKDPEYANYICNKNILLAHARAWRAYDKDFKPKYKGKVGIANQMFWLDSSSSEHDNITELLRHYMTGMYSHAIYSKEGGWPPQIEKIISEKSKKQGYLRSRLPAFTEEEIELVKGSYDYYGINYYTSRLVRKARKGEVLNKWPLGLGAVDLDAVIEHDPSWKKTDTPWFWIYPPGIRKILKWIKDMYGDIEVFITENGLPLRNNGLNDDARIIYYKEHLEQVWLAINEDAVNVIGYTAWTLIDNFEWRDGYSVMLYMELTWAARTFPPWFKFGAATSSYQIEGAWNVSDKGESIWDRFSHERPSRVAGQATGDVACNSYYRWNEDIEVAAELGLHFYRFSLSWPRILPTGLINKISDNGINYYNKLIDGLLERGIKPVITLYHWDLPQRIQNLGGWTNPYVVDWFADYVRVAYTLFGDRVKTWITLNEPVVACDMAYNSGLAAPGITDPEFGNYLCGKNMLLAHAKAWRIYDEEFRSKYHGQVGIANQLLWIEAEKEEDEEFSEVIRQYMVGMYSHPIYSKVGGWPPELEIIIAENSKKEGLPRSRLPPFTEEEIVLIRGTYDFYGLNYYTARLVRKAKENETIGYWPLGDGAVEFRAVMSVRPEWIKESSSWFWTYAPGLRKLLVTLKKSYGDIKILITENGLSTSSNRLDDEKRVNYHRNHLEQVWLAINQDGVNVTGYTAWSMIDTFEWATGYDFKFGLYHVDMNAKNRTRVARASGRYYAKVIRTHSMDVESKYNSGELYSTVLIYTPVPIILVLVFIFLFSCPKYAKMLTAEQRRLLNNPNAS